MSHQTYPVSLMGAMKNTKNRGWRKAQSSTDTANSVARWDADLRPGQPLLSTFQ